jgi:hypothetical protein
MESDTFQSGHTHMQIFRSAAAEADMNGNATSGGTERRRHPRQRVLKSAAIVFRGGNCSIACHILDMSETGALLMPLDVTSCPTEFVLRPRGGAPRNCEVVWRTGRKIGVRYS